MLIIEIKSKRSIHNKNFFEIIEINSTLRYTQTD